MKNGMKESLLEGVDLTPLYIGHPFDKGFLLCLHYICRRAKYYLIICSCMGVWVELYRMVKKAI